MSVSLADYSGETCLIYGIGNVGRQDDGLGWAFIDWLEESGLGGDAKLVLHYQLFFEDADLIRQIDRILFVDATKDADVKTIKLERVEPKFDLSFTSHALSIPAVLALCQQCFGRVPEAQLLTIRGYEWELREGMTAQALENLAVATDFFATASAKNGAIGHDSATTTTIDPGNGLPIG